MRPETVLKLTRNNAVAMRDEWLRAYDEIRAAYPEKTTICHVLSNRVRLACVSLSEGLDLDSPSMDGNFPLGNEEDAAFANPFFSVKQLAEIQCGLHHLINPGHYVEPAYDVLVRRGFLAELDEDWEEAVHCYAGVGTSKIVMQREYMCRRKVTGK